MQSPLQQLRAVRPLGVDRTLTEIWHFRLKGAPEAIYRRSLAYYNLVNSPATLINADDLENFWKMPPGPRIRRRRLGELPPPLRPATSRSDGVTSARTCGTSEAPMRNQIKAWAEYINGAS